MYRLTLLIKTIVDVTLPYLCLHHKGSVHAQIMDDAIHVHSVFPFNLEDQTINGYEGACAPNPSTERRPGRHKEKREKDRISDDSFLCNF